MIKFFRGLRASYDVTTHGAGIYFATDTFEIIHNNASYSGLLLEGKSVKDITLVNGVMTITYTDNTTSSAEIGSGKYASNIEDKTLAMPNAVGGIAKGTKLETLEGKSYDAILDDLLFPTVNPTFTAPSATIKFNGYSATLEVGAAAPTVSSFTTSYSAGQITLNGSKQANRGGALDVANSFIYWGNDASNTTLPTVVSEGNTSYKYRAAYEEGPQPKDNKGNNYSSPLAAGTVDSSSVTVNGTYPWFASTVTPGVLTKLNLVQWNSASGAMSSGEFEVMPHTAAAPQMFKLPKKATNLQMYSTVSKSFETVALSDWLEAESSDSINEVDHTYYTYVYKGADRGSVKLIVKF